MGKVLTVVLLILIALALFAGFFLRPMIDSKLSRGIDLPSQCFTKLQSSHHLYDIRGNANTHELTIQLGRNFDWMQAAATGSMRPALSDGSTAIIVKPQPSELGVGDIIIFKCDSKDIIHRIVRIQNDTYITKGDNNDIDDSKAFGCNTHFADIESQVIGVLY